MEKLNAVTDKEKALMWDMVVLVLVSRQAQLLLTVRLQRCLPWANETSIPGVYVGDCAAVYDNIHVKTLAIALASNAVRTGIVGANACGHELEGIGVQGSN